MKKNLLSVVCTLAVGIIFFVSCSKEGPAGPAGPAGATGAAGPAGAAGPKGDSGVANVIYSAWLDAQYAIDTIITVNGIKDTSYYTIIQAPKLTSTILSRGEIKVYLNVNTAANPVVFPIPYFDISGEYIQPIYAVQAIELDASENFGTFSIGANKYYQYRYVLIPGGVPARSSIDWNNYAAVKAALNLPD